MKLILLLALCLSACGSKGNPAAPPPPPVVPPFTQSLGGTVSLFGTTRHPLNVPRSGNMRLTLSWSAAADLDLYLTNASCQALYPLAACGIVAASDSGGGTQESILRPVNNGDSFGLFVDNLSHVNAASYTLDIRIE